MPRCQQSVPESQFQEQGKVCPNCNYHARLTAAERLRITADKNSFTEYDAGMHSADPLHFPDYAQKIERSQTQTGMRDAVITASVPSRLPHRPHHHGLPFHDGIHGQRSGRKDHTCL